jgi:hypothetical protein
MGKRDFFPLIMAVFCLSFPVTALAAEVETEDKWKPIRVLLGDWEGIGSGFDGESVVQHCYEFILQEQFIHSRTRSEFQPRDEQSVGEIHEDWGFFSFDPEREKIIFRQFLSEGFVNTYVLQESPPGSNQLVFKSESTEGAGDMSARLTFTFDSANQYQLVLELAQPGKDFFECQSLTMARIQ